MKQLKKTVVATTAGAVMAAALVSGAVGAAGLAYAKPHDPCPLVGGNCWVPGDPPGHNPFGPPGQVMNGGVPGPDRLVGVPPGHWGEMWRPFDRDDIPLQPVVWNPDLVAWGIWWADQFIPLPPS
jgi:hypothetical protein